MARSESTPLSQSVTRYAFDLGTDAVRAGGRFEAPGATIDPRAPRQPSITATVLTKNSEARLGQVLDALSWCDEVVVLDTGSSDRTAEIASLAPNVRFTRLEGPFPGFGVAHRQAVALARNDWILSIDSDEVVSQALRAEIAALTLDDDVVYSIPFRNHFNGRFITTCGWHPDRHERLFDRRRTNFCASLVHEKVVTQRMKVAKLRSPIDHYSYDTPDDFLRKMRAYSQLFADQNVAAKSSSPSKAVGHGLWAFFKSYLLQRGCLQGYEGLAISAYKAHTVFWKYLFLHEARLRRP